MRSNYLFTSESVSEGHPDKVADQISDSVVDLFLATDPEARVACETMVTTQRIVLAGEVRSSDRSLISEEGDITPEGLQRIEEAARGVVRRIGYEQSGFHWESGEFGCFLPRQCADIAQGVDASGNKDEGAGDQGIMFGYATDETPDLLPATLYYSHRILERMAADRHSGAADFLEPDAKSQVTLRYENGAPVGAAALVVSTQHSAELSSDEGQARLRDYVKAILAEIMPKGWLPAEEDIFVNPTGNFEIGGPDGDAGLTGRKIIVDTYGGASPHGGGALSGKGPAQGGPPAAAPGRYAPKNGVAAGLAKQCQVQVSYAIGVAKPINVTVYTEGTGRIPDARI